MSVEPFQARARSEPPLAVIDLNGEINGNAEEQLNRAYEEAINHDLRAIALNFNGVSYINSTGIALIVSILARARRDDIPLLTYGLSPHYLEIFEITRLIDFLRVVPDEEAAIGSVDHIEQKVM